MLAQWTDVGEVLAHFCFQSAKLISATCLLERQALFLLLLRLLVPLKLLAKIGIVEGIVRRAVDTEFSDLTGFFFFPQLTFLSLAGLFLPFAPS